MKKIFFLFILIFFSKSLFAEQFKIVCDDFKHYESIHSLHEITPYSSIGLSKESDFYVDLKKNTIKTPDWIWEQSEDSEVAAVISRSPPHKIIQNKNGALLAVHFLEDSRRLRWYYLDLLNLSMMTGFFSGEDENILIANFERGFFGEHFWSRDCVDEGQKLATKLGVKSEY